MNAVASLRSGSPINAAPAGSPASPAAESLVANLLAGFPPPTLAPQFPNLLKHLLAAEGETKPETKNKKEESPGVTAALSLVPGPPPAPVPPPPAAETAVPIVHTAGSRGVDPDRSQHPAEEAQVPESPLAAVMIEIPALPAGPKVPEIHSDAPDAEVAAESSAGTAKRVVPEFAKALPPTDAASRNKPSERVQAAKIVEDSSKPQPPVLVPRERTESPLPSNASPELQPEADRLAAATATTPAPEPLDIAPPAAERDIERKEGAVARPESIASVPGTQPAEAEAAVPPAPENPGVSAPTPKTLAFAARLIPVDNARPVPGPGAAGRPVAVRAMSTTGAPDKPEPARAPVTPGTPNRPVERETAEDAGPQNGPERTPRTVSGAPPVHEPKRPDHAAPQPQAAETAFTPGDPGVTVRGAEPAPLQPDRTAGTAEPHPITASARPESAQPVAPARDIRLQVGGDQRVDVRVTERAGEVQVAVRTPDARLAGVLRDDLPALSARLEQSGFRAETWHPDALKTEHTTRASEPSASGAASEGRYAGRQGGRQDEHQPPPRRAPVPDRNNDAPPKEFSWIFSSLR